MDKQMLLKMVESIRGLEDDWDGYGSHSFDDSTCHNTLWLIENMPDYIFNYNANISPCSGGESIQIEFQNKDKDLEIEIKKNKILYLKAIDVDVEYEEGEFNLDKKNKKNILNLINWLCKDKKMETKITNNNFEEEIIKSSVPVFVDIYSESCAPCKMLYKILLELSSEYGDKIKFCTADIDNNSFLISQFGVSSVPTILFFKDGNMRYKKNGLKTKDSLIKDIEEILL